MVAVARCVYVISDLHLGGRAPSGSDRGFQMMTNPDLLATFITRLAHIDRNPIELVIAGDFVDFLAEDGEVENEWSPLIDAPKRACDVFRRALSDKARGTDRVFVALAKLLERRHALTILLGNHDIELSYPAVRNELARVLGVRPGHGFQFIFDGEAYRIGDALIEHGNRYDAFNVVDHERLRRRRSYQSRGQEDARDDGFEAPIGSKLVAQVMNPLKVRYPFVDLLKPETGAVVPLLLALEPGLRSMISKLVRTLAPALTHGRYPGMDDVPLRLADAASGHDELAPVLERALGGRDATLAFLASVGGDDMSTSFADASAESRSGFWQLLLARKQSPVTSRLPALQRALRALQHDESFRVDVETAPEYRDAAARICERTGVRHVVFGHTHLAREIDLGAGCKYLNSGTWANLLRVPADVIHAPADDLSALTRWVESITSTSFEPWFRPTYVRLDLDENDHVIASHTLEAAGHNLAAP